MANDANPAHPATDSLGPSRKYQPGSPIAFKTLDQGVLHEATLRLRPANHAHQWRVLVSRFGLLIFQAVRIWMGKKRLNGPMNRG